MAKKLIGAQVDYQLIAVIDEARKQIGATKSDFIRQAVIAYAKEILNQPPRS